MSALPSKREFLSQNINPATGLPFAKFPSRGRFSAEAEAFAAANTDKFSAEAPKAAPKPKAPKVEGPKAPTVTLAKAPQPVVSAATGAERAAAALARREARGQVAEAPKVLPVVRPGVKSLPALMPMGNGKTQVIGVDLCQRCTHHISVCPCKAGVKAPAGAIMLDRGVTA